MLVLTLRPQKFSDLIQSPPTLVKNIWVFSSYMINSVSDIVSVSSGAFFLQDIKCGPNVDRLE